MQKIFFCTLKAESYEKKLIKPEDLDIYNEPPDPVVAISYKNPSALQQRVSIVRKFLWRFSGTVKGGYDAAVGTISTTEENLKGFYEEVTKDPVLLAKPGLVSAAVLVGGLIPGRGRKPFKRLFLSTTFGLSVSAICYPNKAIDISWAGYENGKVYGKKAVDYAKEQWNKKPKPLETTLEDKTSYSDDKETSEPIVAEDKEPAVTSLSVNEEEPVALEEGQSAVDILSSEAITVSENEDFEEAKIPSKIETDLGQSNPEDKDMYTTRS